MEVFVNKYIKEHERPTAFKQATDCISVLENYLVEFSGVQKTNGLDFSESLEKLSKSRHFIETLARASFALDVISTLTNKNKIREAKIKILREIQSK